MGVWGRRPEGTRPPPHPHHWGGLEGPGYPLGAPSRPPQQPSLAAYAAVNKYGMTHGVILGSSIVAHGMNYNRGRMIDWLKAAVMQLGERSAVLDQLYGARIT